MTESALRKPPIIDGDLTIVVLDKENRNRRLGMLFHGTTVPCERLTPQIVYWKKDGIKYLDSETEVVCATDNAIIPVFMALAPRRDLPFGYGRNTRGGLDFHLDKNVREEFINATGYVSVLDSEEFEIFAGRMPQGWTEPATERLPEMRITKPQIPLFNLRVSHKDFAVLLGTQPQSRLLYR